MKKVSILLIIFLLSLSTITACVSKTQSPPNGEEQQEDLEDNKDESPHSWITELDDTIMIEGTEESIKLKFYDSEKNFITYVPEDMLTEKVTVHEKDYYMFYANFLGNKNENVFLKLHFLPKGDVKPESPFENSTMEPTQNSYKNYPWSLEEYSGDDVYGILGEHNGQYFTIEINRPAEFADGFGPRANKIIQHLYWTDTNEYLVTK